MPLVRKNTKELMNPETLKLKILIYGLPGSGKTTFLTTAPNPGLGVCETGHGKGLLSVAASALDYVELNSYADFDTFCSGNEFQDKDTLVLDSLSDMTATFVKDKALTVPRSKQGNSAKRDMGVPEMDDYGTMGELTRKLIRKLLDIDKHIVVTSTLRIKEPGENDVQGETLIGPALAGQMFLGSTAMFDIVLCARQRSVVRDPKDPKSRYTERYLLTQSQGMYIAKNRLSIEEGISFLPPELIFDVKKGTGTFSDIFNRAKKAYTDYHASINKLAAHTEGNKEAPIGSETAPVQHPATYSR